MSLRNTRNCHCEIHNNTSGVAFLVFYPVSRSFFTLTTMPPKHRAIRRPKRKFSGNQFTKPSKENAKRTKEAKEEAHGSNTLGQHIKRSVSSEKLLLKSDAMEPKPGKVEEPYEEEAALTDFRFVAMELLGMAFSAMRCAYCGEFSIVLSENYLERRGCASSLRVFCESCGWKHEF